MKTLFGKTFDIIQKALELRSTRNAVLASNIANVDTPGFRQKDLNFRQMMESYMQDLDAEAKKDGAVSPSGGSSLFMDPGSAGQGGLPLAATEPGHIVDLPRSGPREILESEERGVPNNVDLDEQMSKLSENHLEYQAAIQLLVKKFELLREAATEGGRR